MEMLSQVRDEAVTLPRELVHLMNIFTFQAVINYASYQPGMSYMQNLTAICYRCTDQ